MMIFYFIQLYCNDSEVATVMIMEMFCFCLFFFLFQRPQRCFCRQSGRGYRWVSRYLWPVMSLAILSLNYTGSTSTMDKHWYECVDTFPSHCPDTPTTRHLTFDWIFCASLCQDSPSGRVHVTDGELVIEEVVPSDGGLYSCMAVSPSGNASRDVAIHSKNLCQPLCVRKK